MSYGGNDNGNGFVTGESAYRVSAWWSSGSNGLASCDSAISAIHFSSSEEFAGNNGRWTPEQLFLSSLAASFTATFEEVARAANFAYVDLGVDVQGRALNDKSGYNFDEIIVYPTLTVDSEEKLDLAMRLIHRTQARCRIARSIAVPQTFEPTIEVQKPAARLAGGEVEVEADAHV